MDFRAVIFDMDGLLVDSEVLGLDTYIETCKFFDIECDEKVYLDCLGLDQIQGEQQLRAALQAITDADQFIRKWTESYKALQVDRPAALKPGVNELLTLLYERNIPRGVATSSNRATANERLSQTGISQFFTSVVTGDQITHGKPSPDIYLEAARRLSIDPIDCLALEDSDNGVRAAHSAGMTVYQIPDLAKPAHGLGADVIVLASLMDVLDLV